MNEIKHNELIIKSELENGGFVVDYSNKQKSSLYGGCPDFVVSQRLNGLSFNKFWVEVKSESDGLRGNQIEKISQLKQRVYLFVIKKDNIINKYRIKITKIDNIPSKINYNKIIHNRDLCHIEIGKCCCECINCEEYSCG